MWFLHVNHDFDLDSSALSLLLATPALADYYIHSNNHVRLILKYLTVRDKEKTKRSVICKAVLFDFFVCKLEMKLAAPRRCTTCTKRSPFHVFSSIT